MDRDISYDYPILSLTTINKDNTQLLKDNILYLYPYLKINSTK
jgi:hypothetical protein